VVEQRIENPCVVRSIRTLSKYTEHGVVGSILVLGTIGRGFESYCSESEYGEIGRRIRFRF
jgi:hypothetical protein